MLRVWREDDAPALFELAKEPIVGESAGFPPHPDEAESLRVIREIFCNPESYAVVACDDGKLLGCINLFSGIKGQSVYETEEVKMGYWLGRPFWGRGVMVKAVGQLCERCRDSSLFKCTKVIGMAKEVNVRSRRVLEKSGFVLAETDHGACRYEKMLAKT